MNAVIKSKCRDPFADSMATKTQFVGTGKNCQCASSYLNAQSKTFLSENKYTSLVGICSGCNHSNCRCDRLSDEPIMTMIYPHLMI